MKNLSAVLAFLMFLPLSAQDFSGLVDSYLSQNRSHYSLQQQDVAEVAIYNQHFSKKANVHHVYTQQHYQGIPVFNSVANFVIRDGAVRAANVKFIDHLQTKTNTTSPVLTPIAAIQKAAEALGLAFSGEVQFMKQAEANEYIFSGGELSQNDIPVKLVYQPLENGNLHLAWDLNIYLPNSQHWYSVRMDAVSGILLQTHDWVLHCSFDGDEGHKHSQANHSPDSAEEHHFLFAKAKTTAVATPNDGSAYRVYAYPLESPDHGSLTLETEPANPVASPYGWHDIDGIPGPEYTVTRGNNVRARADLSGNNTGASPDGGPGLNFDFSYNLQQPAHTYWEASTVNLFYWNNIIHDVWYHYGFDEAAGNFQENNYGNGGMGGDSVDADAQDGQGMNNANFATPPDGSRPRMQMYLWNSAGAPENYLTLNDGTLQGSYFALPASFGAPIPYQAPITADLVLVEDDNAGSSTDAYDACDNILNPGDVSGKIAVIRRGECQFGYKVLAMENLGAVAVIVVNNVSGDPIAMGPGDDGAQVTIPSVMVHQAPGNDMITALQNSEVINASLLDAGPFPKDGTLDNGVVAHEYGHGISNRLTAGPLNTWCLFNEEQMGEGWSDWTTLVMTMKPTHQAETPRGIGTFAANQATNGNGIRPAPYSTSFGVNPYTYGATNNAGLSRPHGIGFVWATMLWDMTWALIDEYGYDPDIYNGTGGNNMAMQLVVEGLKLQPCEPGFVDGRDAILLADELLYEGANQCLLWRVFARRGLGLEADQGDSNDRFDQVENFEVPEGCELSTPGNQTGVYQLYPNPAEGVVNIQIPQTTAQEVRLSLFDLKGSKVLEQQLTIDHTAPLDISRLSPGLYLVKIAGNGWEQVAKLVVR